ncbi:hypothetical protein CMU40_02295 [Elizabethkingia anophelis]|jgi:hypothetical protein|uniref:GAPS4b N-terminal domain-containing protein n=2 Tax=Bacteroidota TaxID=976 RepID=A0A318U929_9SPHI|nr:MULTISPECIES: hypothetical protein [Bacteroidota]MBN9299114.1 hypothetical protein [Filimonas sp.]MDV2466315.1 hypothetical protein [Elizabethkingia anophelis]OJV56441.1 MAG: hypothetical protein BGO31_15250 [Bacteroidetes bacterium 43-16]MDV3725020.1 hypothetical protein [Elizabethkingia anophelis]MDV3730541.1 hypothetical protein [Elizabethkingia anophelis]
MEKLEVNKHIPFGATLQDVLNHPSLSDTKLKYLLRLRGIYLEDSKNNDTYPILLSTILSPSEFEYIKENIRGKELNQKILSRPLAWHNTDDLIKVVPDKIDLKEIIRTADSRQAVISQTNFAMVEGNPNKVKMQFRCQTNNYNSGWYRTKNEYDGEIVLEKVQENDKVYLRMIYTSPETQTIADLGVKHLVNEFKSKNYTKPNTDVERILYSNFTNEERIKFFLSLTDSSEIFEFQRATDLDIAPDRTMEMPIEIAKLMTGKVNTLKINGETLHEHYLINENENHKYIELASVEALYNFSYHAAEGNCVVQFGFNGYFKKRLSNIEFSIDVSTVNLKDEYKGVNKDKVRLFLLQEFEKFKMEKYNLLKSQPHSVQHTT